MRFAFIYYVDCNSGHHWHLLSLVLAVIRLAHVMLLQADTLLLENYVLPVDLWKRERRKFCVKLLVKYFVSWFVLSGFFKML